MVNVAHRGPKGLEFTPEICGRAVIGDRACRVCGVRMYWLTGRWRLITTKSGGRTLRRVQVKCRACGHSWWSSTATAIRASTTWSK
jgi:hypothetical protein